jgi:hypothetical protein
MTDNERAELWKQLKTQEAEAIETLARNSEATKELELVEALSFIRIRLQRLGEAASIRTLLAKIESIGEP